MEGVVWAFIVIVLIILFKALRLEKTDPVYYEIQLRKTATKTLFRNKEN